MARSGSITITGWPGHFGTALSETLADPHSVTYVVQPESKPHAAAVEAAAQEPAWKEPVVLRLVELLQLPERWDSYEARRIQGKAVSSALYLLESSAGHHTPMPSIVPTADGGIQLEWHALGVDMELVVSPAEAPQLFFRDRRTAEEWERELGADLGPLSMALRILAERAGQERDS